MAPGNEKRSGKSAWALLLLLLFALAGVFALDRVFFSSPMRLESESRELMDTQVTVSVYDTDKKRAKEAIEAAFTRMEEIELIASIYDERAQAYRLNEYGELEDPSPELVEILTAAKQYYEISGGVFDVTVEPLLALWRYRQGAERQFWELGEEEQKGAISNVMPVIGPKNIYVEPGVVSLKPGTKITLGGLAKGYAVDQGLKELREIGIEHALIDAGGDIGVMGGRPDGDPWEIALRNPGDRQEFLTSFRLREGAVATSGNYERYFDEQAEVGHIMDPRTGYSAQTSSSATVIAPTCMQADAMATAVFVLGPVEGIRLANSIEDLETLIVGYDDPSQLYRSDGLEVFEFEQ